MMFRAPAIYFPSTVIFLDDDSLYAKLLIDRLPKIGVKYFESPDFMLKQKKDDFLFVDNDIFKKVGIGEVNYIEDNLASLKRSGNLVSVVVSDLHMQTCTGTEIFSEIASPFIGRILVSNFIAYQKNSDVTEAINGNFVDIVLDKTKNFTEELPKAILAAKNKFFTALSNALFADASDHNPLKDTEFAKFFIAKIEEHKPEEIISNSAFNRFTFKLLNGNELIIHVTEKNEIRSFLESSSAETAPPELLSHLSSGAYMLCYDDEILPEGRSWPLLMRPAKPLDGKNTRYFYNIST